MGRPSGLSQVILLDTHAFFWAVAIPTRLSSAIKSLLQDESVTVAVSAATAWELSTKHRIGKWHSVEPLLRSYPVSLQRLRATEVPVDGEIALMAGGMEWEHRDPFDRVIAATALTRGVALATCDEAFASVEGLTVVW